MNHELRRKLKHSLALVVWVFVLNVLDLAVIWTTRRRGTSCGRKRILFVRPDAIGDFVVWLPAAEAWCRALHDEDNCHVTVLTHHACADLASKLGYFDQAWPLDVGKFRSNLVYRLRIMARIRRAGFHATYYPVHSRDFVTGDSIVRVSGAPQRVGSEACTARMLRLQKWLSDGWYTHLVPAGTTTDSELHRNAAFLSGIGIRTSVRRYPSLPPLGAPPEQLKGQTYYVLFPGALKEYRCWPADRFAELARRIHEQTGWIGILCGAGHERNLCSRIIDEAGVAARNLAGETTICELAEVMRSARIVVSNETGAAHLAAAVDTPCICILGGGQFGRFVPYPGPDDAPPNSLLPIYEPMDCFGCVWKCIYPRAPGAACRCIEAVSVERIWSAVMRTIARIELPSKCTSSDARAISSCQRADALGGTLEETLGRHRPLTVVD